VRLIPLIVLALAVSACSAGKEASRPDGTVSQASIEIDPATTREAGEGDIGNFGSVSADLRREMNTIVACIKSDSFASDCINSEKESFDSALSNAHETIDGLIATNSGSCQGRLSDYKAYLFVLDQLSKLIFDVADAGNAESLRGNTSDEVAQMKQYDIDASARIKAACV
jgi:hypothetical protein